MSAISDPIFDRPRPRIGERAMFWLLNDVRATGTIMDIRADERGEMVACIAVLGWPHMSHVKIRQYFEQRDGVWRSCQHKRGFNAAGLCFDCLSLPPEEEPKV